VRDAVRDAVTDAVTNAGTGVVRVVKTNALRDLKPS